VKIAVTSKGTEMDSPVDPRFGRAPYVLVVDTETGAHDVLDNKENANALKGAGIQAAAMVSRAGAEILLTGHCGPNAFKALAAGKIRVANNATGSVDGAVQAYLRGELPLATGADVDGQW
jgi:predicted Fe-Mo cluster-binding NifX family protein